VLNDPAQPSLLTLTDGRQLAWAEQGQPDGVPVLSLHGAPGSRLSRHPDAEALAAAGIRQITYDRPGYGWSTRRPGRTVADAVPDIVQLLDALELQTVAVVGGSGGGPHALAMATLAAERCTRVHCVVGVAPFDAQGLDFYEGMDPENIRRFEAARAGAEACERRISADLSAMVHRALTAPETAFGEMQLPEQDRALLTTLGPHLALSLVEAARQGAAGGVDDLIACVSPWGFDLADATAPVVVEYRTDDVNVPASHGAWLAAHTPTVDVKVSTGGGHLEHPDTTLDRLMSCAALVPPNPRGLP
jgi:pimeloyl-ACP methyl ester carboxylesterase